MRAARPARRRCRRSTSTTTTSTRRPSFLQVALSKRVSTRRSHKCRPGRPAVIYGLEPLPEPGRLPASPTAHVWTRASRGVDDTAGTVLPARPCQCVMSHVWIWKQLCVCVSVCLSFCLSVCKRSPKPAAIAWSLLDYNVEIARPSVALCLCACAVGSPSSSGPVTVGAQNR
jgi:hypothetical protein